MMNDKEDIQHKNCKEEFRDNQEIHQRCEEEYIGFPNCNCVVRMPELKLTKIL